MVTKEKHLVEPLNVLPSTTPGVQIELYPDYVRLRRTDILSTLFGRKTTFRLNEIASVHLYESRHANRGLLVLVGHDENRLMEMYYACENHHDALKLQEAIEARIG
ncbi:MAG: hypothetical protein H6671_10310 [Anaerolineaceae bacterium]|nr:hypothetical protein [Anaerolineaceae bacterium]